SGSKSNNDTRDDINDHDVKYISNNENKYDDDNNYSNSSHFQHNFGMTIIEPLLLLTIYVIMSQPFVINFASHYVEQLNPSDDGSTPLSGILIYGIILVILFMVLRKIFQYKIQ